MGIKITLTDSAPSPALHHDGTYDEKNQEITLPRGIHALGIGGFIFAEVSDCADLRNGENTFWYKFPEIKYIKNLEDQVLFKNWDLCPHCDMIDHIHRKDRKNDIIRLCRQCGQSLPMRI